MSLLSAYLDLVTGEVIWGKQNVRYLVRQKKLPRSRFYYLEASHEKFTEYRPVFNSETHQWTLQKGTTWLSPKVPQELLKDCLLHQTIKKLTV